MPHIFWFQHRYVPIICNQLYQHYKDYLTGNILDIPGCPVTDILLRCSCGAFKNKLVKGHVTAAELKK